MTKQSKGPNSRSNLECFEARLETLKNYRILINLELKKFNGGLKKVGVKTQASRKFLLFVVVYYHLQKRNAKTKFNS